MSLNFELVANVAIPLNHPPTHQGMLISRKQYRVQDELSLTPEESYPVQQ